MAKKGLEEIVGSQNILDSAELLEEYSGDLSFAPRVKPGCVVKPKNTEEVQALVKWANETRTLLVAVSSGPPHFRGDTVPGTGKAVIVDLSSMKQVLRVDRRNRVAMIEPGVTFSELIPKLQQEGLRLNLPLLPRPNKSVIGSMLEREPVLMPLYQWDAIDPLTCIEVIFGTGDLFRTGSASGPGTLEDQWKTKQAQVNPMGPGQTDFARVVQGAQGTLGLVTWATVKCEAMPKSRKPFLIASDNFEKLSDLIYRLLWLKVGDECLVLNNSDMAAILSKGAGEYKRLRESLPPWLLYVCLAGYDYFPQERVEYQEKAMLEAARQLGLEPVSALAELAADELLKILDQPSAEPYWKLGNRGACQDIFFLTTLDRVPKFVRVMDDLAEQYGYPFSEMGSYVQPMVQGTSCHCEFNLFYDPANQKEAAAIRELYSKAGEALIESGAFFSRPYGEWADMAYRRDEATVAALKNVKQIFDPNNILNSGKLCF